MADNPTTQNVWLINVALILRTAPQSCYGAVDTDNAYNDDQKNQVNTEERYYKIPSAIVLFKLCMIYNGTQGKKTVSTQILISHLSKKKHRKKKKGKENGD